MPRETANGPDRVAVRRGGEQSIAMPLLVEAANPSLFMHVGASSLIVQTFADAPAAGPAGVASQLALGRPSVAATPARQLLETAAIRLGTLFVSDRPRPFALDR